MVLADVPFKENLVDWLWMAAGVTLAVVWPWLREKVKETFNVGTAGAAQDLKKAGLLAVFAGATAILVLAIYRSSEPDTAIQWYAALLAGFGYEAAFEKVTGVTT